MAGAPPGAPADWPLPKIDKLDTRLSDIERLHYSGLLPMPRIATDPTSTERARPAGAAYVPDFKLAHYPNRGLLPRCAQGITLTALSDRPATTTRGGAPGRDTHRDGAVTPRAHRGDRRATRSPAACLPGLGLIA